MKLPGKNMVRAIKLVVSCTFFFILFSFIQGNELLAIFRRIDWLYFSLSYSLIPVMLAASCLKWKVVLGERAGHVSFLQLLRIYAVGYFFSNLLPSTVGGDVVRSYYAGRLLGSQSYAAVSIFVERFTGILVLFFLVAAAPLLSPELYAIPYVWIPSCAGVALLCISCYLCLAVNPLALPRRILNLILGGLHAVASRSGSESAKRMVCSVEDTSVVFLKKLQKVREELELAIATFRRDRMYLLQVAGLTIVFYFLTWVNVYVSFRAFGVDPDFLAVCALVPAILFAAHLPVTLLGNLGYFESVFVFYFLLIGIPGAETLAMGILLRLKMLTMGVIGYIVYLFYSQDRELDLKNLKEMTGR
jgi:uncharacterized protein (TIRG00374 family)